MIFTFCPRLKQVRLVLSALSLGAPVLVRILSELMSGQNANRNYRHKTTDMPNFFAVTRDLKDFQCGMVLYELPEIGRNSH